MGKGSWQPLWYTSKEVLDALQEGIDLFLDIDVNGALRVKEHFENACLIFIEPRSPADLMKRLTLRGNGMFPEDEKGESRDGKKISLPILHN